MLGKYKKFWYKHKKKAPPKVYERTAKVTQVESTTALHGYHGFKIYFPYPTEIMDDELSTILKQVSAFQQHLKRHEVQYSLILTRVDKVLLVDLTFLYGDYKFLNDWSSFKVDVIYKTERTLACMGLAVHQIISIKESISVPAINVRILNHQPVIQLKDLKTNMFGNLVSIRGTVIKASNVRLFCKSIEFSCSACTVTQIVEQQNGLYSIPNKCTKRDCRTKSNFTPAFNSINTKTVGWQILKLQGVIKSNFHENGRRPKMIECELMDDLINSCIPGDDITVTGIVKVRNSKSVEERKSQQPSVFVLYIRVVSVINNKNRTKPGSIDQSTDYRVNFNRNDYYAIQKIHAEPSLFRFLTHSLCPNIYGNEIVKAGLLLVLLGGTSSSSFSGYGDITTRSVSHALLVGDPGLGKSRLLNACTAIAPRGIYVCGGGSTNSGLTITMTKESNSGYSLEAGALVLADQGCCCIDEFDKMDSQHAVLEAMEQQSISIAKAGISCNLTARTSVLAAANPTRGHYDKSKTVVENLKLTSPLISRFDIVFILLDNPCEKRDGILSEHILALRSGIKHAKSLPPYETEILASNHLADHLKLKQGEKIDYLPPALLQKYIAYAQKYVHPIISLEAQLVLKEFYLKLRRNHQQSYNSTPITARQLESLLRLTQARAKIELREKATAQDARDVVEIIKRSFLDVFLDEKGVLDFGRSQNGSGISRRDNIKKLLLVLQERAVLLNKSNFSREELKKIALETGVSKNQFEETLEKLNLHGFLLKKSGQKYQLTSVD